MNAGGTDSNETFESWCARNSPRLGELARHVVRVPLEDIKEQIETALASMAALLADLSQKIVASGSVTGPGTMQAILGDVQLKEKKRGSPEFLELFKTLPLSGCTTVLDMARIRSGFNPTNPDHDDNFVRFMHYLAEVSKSPFFPIRRSSKISYERKTSDWHKAIDEIVSHYNGIAESDRGTLRSTLTSLANAAASWESTRSGQNLFIQKAIDVDSRIVVRMYSSSVAFQQDSDKGGTTRQTSFAIISVELEFDTARWNEAAATVAQHHYNSVQDWLNNNSTPKGPHDARLSCLTPSIYGQ